MSKVSWVRLALPTIILGTAGAMSPSAVHAQNQTAERAIDRLMESNCPQYGDTPGTSVLENPDRASRLAELNWRAVEDLAAEAAKRLNARGDLAKRREEVGEADALLGRMTTALAGFVESHWALAQQAEGPLGRSPHPLKEARAALDQLASFSRDYSGSPQLLAFVHPIETRFTSCLTEIQNSILQSDINALRNASSIEAVAPISPSLQAVGVYPNSQLRTAAGNKIRSYSGLSDSEFARKRQEWARIRKDLSDDGYAAATATRPATSATTAPAPKSAPPQAPKVDTVDQIAAKFHASVRSANQPAIASLLAPNIVYTDPQSGRTYRGPQQVSSQLASTARLAAVKIGSMSKLGSNRFKSAITAMGRSGGAYYTISESKIVKLEMGR